jgi:hypothetical protein
VSSASCTTFGKAFAASCLSTRQYELLDELVDEHLFGAILCSSRALSYTHRGSLEIMNHVPAADAWPLIVVRLLVGGAVLTRNAAVAT